MYCSRCGTPLRTGDRFCPRCGAAAPDIPAGPGRKGTKGPGGIRTGWVVLAMVLMVLVLLAAAVYSQRDQLNSLFEQPPRPTPRPGQAGVEQLEDRLARDEAGSLVLTPLERPPVGLPDRAYDMAGQAGQQALETLYGSEPITAEGAGELFCNLSAGGYDSFETLAEEVNESMVDTLWHWTGALPGEPVVRGNRAYQSVLLYAVKRNGKSAPYDLYEDLTTEELLICMIWSGSRWRVDASTMSEFLLRGHERFLFSAGMREALDAGRIAFFWLGASTLAEPVIPDVCDTLVREVYLTAEGDVAICSWAFNGTSEPLDAEQVDLDLFSNQGDWYYADYAFPIEPLHLEPGEGKVITVIIPAEELWRPLSVEGGAKYRMQF